MKGMGGLVLLAAVAFAGDEAPRDSAVVIDLATEKPVPEFAVVVHTGAGTTTLRTDAEGRLRMPAGDVRILRPHDAKWKLAPQRPDGRLLVYRMIRFEGKLLSTRGLPLSNPGVYRAVYGFARDPERERNLGTGAPRALTAGVEPTGELPAPGEDGVIRAELPAIRGLLVRVEGPTAFVPAQLVPLGAPLDKPMLLQLRMALPVEGTVVDDTGRPIAGATVRGYFAIEGTRDVLDLAAVKKRFRRNDGLGMRSSAKRVRAHTSMSAKTDAKGGFRFELPTDGSLRITVPVEGHGLGEPQLRWIDRPIDGWRITLPRNEAAPRLPLQFAGDAVPAGTQLALIEFHANGDQILVRMQTDASGAIDTAWLRKGGRYRVGDPRQGCAYFVWPHRGAVTLTPGLVPMPEGFLPESSPNE